jgi:uncharacterized protein involved in exopolysaccharide biosynthesis
MENHPQHMIELKSMFLTIWRDRVFILIFVFIMMILALLITFSLPDEYRSEVLVAPSETFANELPSQLGGLGSLAALAGSKLGQNNSKILLATEYFRSRIFLEQFLLHYPEALIELMAIDDWVKSTDTLIYNTDVYDPQVAQWVREAKPTRPSKPTLQEAHRVFLKHLSVEEQSANAFFVIAFEHASPVVAKKWVDRLVKEVNAILRQKDINKTQVSINYLEAQLATTDVSALQQSLFALVQTQTEKLMLAQTSPEYIFEIIDPAYIPEKKNGPKRVLIIFLVGILGTITATVFSIIRGHLR